ncbi:Hypothetical predicted protein [Mytilus galloprovincialis]|uniref:Mab-21-like HhH/H2TH-like domain-containing protein n=1 Tax=Mytilus galloprovincialis TaxID=29158 RepID=A0A8B6HMY4_MYTGA|nr:Hypothetical predicted protein [Mytilus galloprovincialis]
MNLKDKNLSLLFYNYLCEIIGSEEVVRTRREIFSAKDIVEHKTLATCISSGSKAEGLDLTGSDYDQMVLLSFIRVYESFNNVQYDPYQLLLVMDTEDTKPGFTKLKSVHKSDIYSDILCGWGETVGEESYISSKHFREKNLCDHMVNHGPCQSTPEGEYDLALCFRCNEWITSAQQWIHRSRTTWPHYTLVTSAAQYGVLFVPIGCKNSPNENLQWRISFSVTEKLLIHSFSHTQLLCYALMKIILKELIKPKHGDLLCSYFIKTIIFWLSEEIRPSEWKPENMIPCFLECIRRLIYCVEYKTCLHYFIPENNLFEDRFTDREHKSLLNTLRIIYETPLISVYQTSTLQNYKLESARCHRMILSASELPFYTYMNGLNVLSMSQPICHAIKHLVKIGLNKKLCTYLLPVYARDVIQSYHLCNIVARNKSFYQQYKTFVCFVKISVRSESISTWLLLASLFFKCKQFQECFVLINYCLSRCSPNKIHQKLTHSFVEQTLFKEMKQQNGLLPAMKHLIVQNVCFKPPYCLLPDELIPLIIEDTFFIPPVVYSYLLQFLCCHHLGDYKGKHNALHKLELTTIERYFIIENVSTARIILASLYLVNELL